MKLNNFKAQLKAQFLIWAFFNLIFFAGCAKNKNSQSDEIAWPSIQDVHQLRYDSVDELVDTKKSNVIRSSRDNLKKNNKFIRHTNNNSDELTAKLFDIPLPLGAHSLKVEESHFNGHHDQSLLNYGLELDRQDAALFYLDEMERLGWTLKAKMLFDEALLEFEKLGKLCIVSIRPLDPKKLNNQLKIKIFQQQKKG